ncbi:MAG: hypothetical protein K1X28_00825 [Parachlamydiales bacterium]|nr:hypothetical protein [Parachlamydiales bacterium]
MGAVVWNGVHGLKMPGLLHASFCNSAEPAGRWVKLTFNDRASFDSMATKLNERIVPYLRVMKGQRIPGERAYKIQAEQLPDGDVYQIKSAIQIIHFLNKNFDSERVQDPVPVMDIADLEATPYLPPLALEHSPHAPQILVHLPTLEDAGS